MRKKILQTNVRHPNGGLTIGTPAKKKNSQRFERVGPLMCLQYSRTDGIGVPRCIRAAGVNVLLKIARWPDCVREIHSFRNLDFYIRAHLPRFLIRFYDGYFVRVSCHIIPAEPRYLDRDITLYTIRK